MKKTMNEFKEFIAKGNVFSMAVGVVTVSYTHLRAHET